MEKLTLREVLESLDGTSWNCSYRVTNIGLKISKTVSGRAQLIYYNQNLLIKWDNETMLEHKIKEIPQASFSEAQNVEYDGRTILIKTPKWEMYFRF